MSSSVLRYDPQCFRFSTAVGAVLRLAKRGKWSLLAELGVGPEAQFPLLLALDAEWNPYNPDELVTLLRAVPGLLDAALVMLGKYAVVTSPQGKVA